jgi:hypothetical protein
MSNSVRGNTPGGLAGAEVFGVDRVDALRRPFLQEVHAGGLDLLVEEAQPIALAPVAE